MLHDSVTIFHALKRTITAVYIFKNHNTRNYIQIMETMWNPLVKLCRKNGSHSQLAVPLLIQHIYRIPHINSITFGRSYDIHPYSGTFYRSAVIYLSEAIYTHNAVCYYLLGWDGCGEGMVGLLWL